MDRERLNQLRRLAGLPQDFSCVKEAYTSSVSSTAFNPDSLPHPDLDAHEEDNEEYRRDQTVINLVREVINDILDNVDTEGYNKQDLIHYKAILTDVQDGNEQHAKETFQSMELPARQLLTRKATSPEAKDIVQGYFGAGSVHEGEDKASIQKQIDDLQKQKVNTAGHGRRARIQARIDDLEAKLKMLSEGYNTYGGWRAAVKKKHGPNVEFEGDKDIAQAFVMKNGKRTGVGEWDGAVGELYESEKFETGHKFKKGDHVMYKGEKMVVVVPDAKADFVGVVPLGHEDDKEDVDLVRVSKLHVVEERMDTVDSLVTRIKNAVNDGMDPKAAFKRVMATAPAAMQTKVEQALKTQGVMERVDTVGSLVTRIKAAINDGMDAKAAFKRVMATAPAAMQTKVEQALKADGVMESELAEADTDTRGFKNFGSWKSTLKKVYPGAEVSGDESKASATIKRGNKHYTVGSWSGSEGEIKHGVVLESMHYHTNDAYPNTHVDHETQPVNVTAPYPTIFDKEKEEDEEDYQLANDDTEVKVPQSILNDLKKVIDGVKKEAEQSYHEERKHYYQDTCDALQIVHDQLSKKTVEGLKRAQLYAHRMLNVSRALIPDHVWKFIVDGGQKRSLKDYMNDVKGMKYPITGPRNTLDNND